MADISADVTLEDGAWMDSFDKLLAPRDVLRELKIIKKDVRASFNKDSSVEETSIQQNQAHPVIVVSSCSENETKSSGKAAIQSTAAVRQFPSNPFKCSLSPIGAWRRRAKSKQVTKILHATPIAERSAVVVEFERSVEQPSPVLLQRASHQTSSSEIAPRQIPDVEISTEKRISLESSAEDTSDQPIERRSANVASNRKEDSAIPTGENAIQSATAVGQFPSNPFKCSLSPIGLLRLRTFGQNENDKFKRLTKKIYHATPIAQKSTVVDFEKSIDSSLTLLQRNSEQTQRNQIALRQTDADTPRKTKRSARQVCFDILTNSKVDIPFGTCNPKIRRHNPKRSSQKLTAPTETQELPKDNVMRTRSCSVRRRSSERPVALRLTQELRSVNAKVTRNSKVKSLNLRRKSKKSTAPPANLVQERPKSLVLQPGKWEKALNALRRTNLLGNRVSLLRESTVVENSVEFLGEATGVGYRKSIYVKLEDSANSLVVCSVEQWRSRVLQRCQQDAPLPFTEFYGAERLLECRKIGEGAYGEVFKFSSASNPQEQTVLKVIPIEGPMEVNGEVQKSFEQIYPEIVISTELSSLSDKTKRQNATCGFAPVQRISCVQGAYPALLIKLWEEYDAEKESENDHPNIFQNTQLYIAMELGDGGKDLEAFVFNNAEQAYYALQQIVLTLAVAEVEFEFEHRDLHWGNILLMPTALKHQKYKLDGKELTIPTKGVKITIIDYTLSRMTVDGCCLYNDLSNDEDLFTATGDYQYDIYRMMRDVLHNNWENFEPKTNVYWISYVVSKLLDGVSYKSTRTKTHQNYMTKLSHFSNIVLDFTSALTCAKYLRKEA